MAAKKKTEAAPPARGATLRVVGVQITDVLGATAYEMKPGSVTVLEGPNGSGKSTALQAVQAALGRGNLARLARVGAEGEEIEPRVVLELEAPGEHYRVECEAGSKRVRQRVGDTAGLADIQEPPGQWLAGLYDPTGSNPIHFLNAPDKERALLLLEALPLEHDRAALLKAMQVTPEELRAMADIPDGLHPLEELELIRGGVFRQRTGVNRDQKGKAEAAEQTRRNAPAALPENPADEILRTQQRADKLTEELAAGNERAQADEAKATADARAAYKLASAGVAAELDRVVSQIRTDHEAKAAEIRMAAERRIAELKAQAEVELDAARSKADDELASANEAMNAGLQKARDARGEFDHGLVAVGEALAQAKQQLATLRAQAEESSRARALYAQAKQFDEEATRLAAESERLTAAIDALDAYRRKLASNLPIEGLEIRDRSITVHGIPYETLNTAQRVAIAVKVATLRAEGHRLPVLFVDGAEALDAAHFEALCSELKASGLQAFLARVEDTPELQARVVA